MNKDKELNKCTKNELIQMVLDLEVELGDCNYMYDYEEDLGTLEDEVSELKEQLELRTATNEELTEHISQLEEANYELKEYAKHIENISEAYEKFQETMDDVLHL